MPNIKRYSKWHFKFPKGIPNDSRLFLFKFALSSFNIWLIELRGYYNEVYRGKDHHQKRSFGLSSAAIIIKYCIFFYV